MAKKDLHVVGASKSLKMTISEISQFLGDNSGSPATDLRPFLHRELAQLSKYWFARGVRRGHLLSLGHFKNGGAVPDRLTYRASREFFTGQKLAVRVKSRRKKF